MFKTIIQKIIFAITIILCLGLISCGETNQPINDNEHIVINIDDNEPIVGDPVVTIDDNGQIFIDGHFVYDIYDASSGAYVGALIHRATIASDLIVVTEVYEVDNSKNPHTAYLTITETLHGSTNDTEIKVNTNRFSKNEKYIFFLRKDGDRYVLISNLGNGHWDYYTSSIISLNLPWIEFWQDDIKSIRNAYDKNKELFLKAGKQDIFLLYPQLKSWFVKTQVLATILIDVGVDKQDIPVLLEWKQVEADDMGVVSILLDHIIRVIEVREG